MFFCFKKASPIRAALGVLLLRSLVFWESLSVNKRSGFPPQWNFVPVSAIPLSLRQSHWGLKAALGSAGSPHPPSPGDSPDCYPGACGVGRAIHYSCTHSTFSPWIANPWRTPVSLASSLILPASPARPRGGLVLLV